MPRTQLFWFLIIVLGLAAFEAGSFATLFVVERLAPYLVYRVPQTPKARFDAYLTSRHQTLGWVQGHEGGAPRARPVPAAVKTLPVCAALYGDSFSYGLEVDDAEAWPALLSRSMGCRVENWAVPGYGIDQSVMMQEANRSDRARVAILGIWPEGVMRSLNQWQYLITVGAGGEYSFKPRFVLKDGRLTRVEMPQLDYGSYVICARDPAACLQQDDFLPDGPSGPVRKTFPYSAALFRLFTGTRVAGYLSGRASWERFLEPGHDGAALTKAMLRRFRDVARSRGQVPLVVIFPTVGSARIYANEARIATAPISEAAAALGLGVVDLHQPIHRRSGGDICSVLVSAERCGGHFNARGNAIIAETLETPLRKRLSGPDGGRR